MRVGPERPVQRDGGPSLGRRVQRRGRRALNAALGVAVALEVDGGDVLHGAVAGDGAGHALWDRVHVRVLVGVVELVLRAADGGLADVAVAGHEGGEGESCQGLHFCGTGRGVFGGRN